MINRGNRSRAKSSEIESSEQRRKRLAKNKRQREMWGPVHRRRRVQFARRIERGDFPNLSPLRSRDRPRSSLGSGPR